MTALQGLRLVELGENLPVAAAGNVFADLGAEAVCIEPPAGSPVRAVPGYTFYGRGKKSIVLDLHDPADAKAALGLMAGADVVVTSIRLRTLAAMGLDYATVSAVNPRVVYGSITGWGQVGPMKDVKGYEGLVLAKLGVHNSAGRMVQRPGPAYVTVPFASWSATQTLLQGVFAALYERESSGAGQLVETSLAHSLGAFDPWTQALAVIAARFPDAFGAIAPPIMPDGTPLSAYTYKLLVAITKDGHWLQFSQTQPRLFEALLRAMGFDGLKDDPEWSEFIRHCIANTTINPEASPGLRVRFWQMMIDQVKSRTLAQWQTVFDADRNVFAEVYRRGTELLHHPQIEAEHQVVTLQDRRHGAVRQPASLIHFSDTPAQLGADAPDLDEHRDELLARAAVPASPASSFALAGGLPLAGLTILELGTFDAAPYGVTVLTDLGARVIKVEDPGGDPMRTQQAFPEAGAMKVLQGKESVAVDIRTVEGRAIVERLAAISDLVMCSFRMGVANRLGVGADELRRINPNLMYLEAPGFGINLPYGNRPAFAPTMSAGSGISMRNAGELVPPGVPDTFDEIRARSGQLQSAGGGAAVQPDGVAGLAVGTALAAAAYVQRTGKSGQRMLTTMLHSCGHLLGEDMVEFDGRWKAPTADPNVYGLNALYRLYETADGWVFLAAPTESDWTALVDALGEDLKDSRFLTPAARKENDDALAKVLESIFRTRPAQSWESELLGRDLGCVVVETESTEQILMGPFSQEHGWLAIVDSPILGEYPRLGPFNTFSRSATRATVGSTLGQHTAAVLREIGYPDQHIDDLATRKIVVVGSP